MATTQFAFCCMNAPDSAHYAAGATFEIKTPSSSSAATTAAANASQNVCRVATDTAVYVAFGSAPTASSTGGALCPANTVTFHRVSSGDKAAVITI